MTAIEATPSVRPSCLTTGRSLRNAGSAPSAPLERSDDETLAAYKIGVSEGLDKVLRALPIQTLAIVDENRRITRIGPRALTYR